jgi:hypothetical protein
LQLRSERARKHFNDLKLRIDALREINLHLIPADRQFDFSPLNAPLLVLPDQMTSILIGEVVQNLRSVLDYLIYALAWIDSGTFQDGTQFPIDRCRKEFERRERGLIGKRGNLTKPQKPRLIGLTPEHFAVIETLQPFNGCDWTARLRNLSNHDKHRSLLKLSANGQFTFTINDISETKTRSYSLAEPLPYAMHMESRLTGEIGFEDGAPVINTLEILQAQVSHLLVQFDPIFNTVR